MHYEKQYLTKTLQKHYITKKNTLQKKEYITKTLHYKKQYIAKNNTLQKQ